MPFSKKGGRVVFFLEEFCEGEAFGGNHAGASDTGEDVSDASSKRHAPRHETISGGGADGRGTVGIGEAKALGGEVVDGWGGNL